MRPVNRLPQGFPPSVHSSSSKATLSSRGSDNAAASGNPVLERASSEKTALNFPTVLNIPALLLVDLDNTLVDRAFAFIRWAAEFVRDVGGSAADVAWLIEADDDGYQSRESLAAAINARFETRYDIRALIELLLFQHVGAMVLDSATAVALDNARSHGWKIGVVTNGTVRQQMLKVQTVGLERHVDAVVISEAEGVKKPDPRIFHLAAERVGVGLSGSWMVGDHPTADISGGRGAGLATGWVSRGRDWPSGLEPPSLSGRTAAAVIDAIVTPTQTQ
jgi:FMN phosphatase YigB (HAD superfamily)